MMMMKTLCGPRHAKTCPNIFDTSEISTFKLASVAVLAGLHLIWSNTLKTAILVTRPK